MSTGEAAPSVASQVTGDRGGAAHLAGLGGTLTCGAEVTLQGDQHVEVNPFFKAFTGYFALHNLILFDFITSGTREGKGRIFAVIYKAKRSLVRRKT